MPSKMPPSSPGPSSAFSGPAPRVAGAPGPSPPVYSCACTTARSPSSEITSPARRSSPSSTRSSRRGPPSPVTSTTGPLTRTMRPPLTPTARATHAHHGAGVGPSVGREPLTPTAAPGPARGPRGSGRRAPPACSRRGGCRSMPRTPPAPGGSSSSSASSPRSRRAAAASRSSSSAWSGAARNSSDGLARPALQLVVGLAAGVEHVQVRQRARNALVDGALLAAVRLSLRAGARDQLLGLPARGRDALAGAGLGLRALAVGRGVGVDQQRVARRCPASSRQHRPHEPRAARRGGPPSAACADGVRIRHATSGSSASQAALTAVAVLGRVDLARRRARSRPAARPRRWPPPRLTPCR